MQCLAFTDYCLQKYQHIEYTVHSNYVALRHYRLYSFRLRKVAEAAYLAVDAITLGTFVCQGSSDTKHLTESF